MLNDGEVIETVKAKWEFQKAIDASSFPDLLEIAENCLRIKEMLYEVVRIGRNEGYAERSCSLNRASNLLVEIDGMRRLPVTIKDGMRVCE